MTRDDIIRMARECGVDTELDTLTCYGGFFEVFEQFASLVAAAKREAWRNAAIRVGENLATFGPTGYYNFTSQQWLDWALNVTTKMQDDYMQLGACGEREAIAQMIEDAPALVPLAKNDQGGCVVCGFDPKFAASYIRARSEG